MAVPKHRISKARSRRRHSINSKLEVPSLSDCPSCGAMKMPHRVCPKCGTYRGKQVINTEDLA